MLDVTKATMETRKAVRVPKRSAAQPLSGRKTALASRLAVIVTLRSSGLWPRSFAMAGSALMTKVELIDCIMKAPPKISGMMGR